MKCTMQWGTKCESEATHELRQYKDIKNPDPNKTYNLGFNCETHVPEKNTHQYIIEEIK